MTRPAESTFVSCRQRRLRGLALPLAIGLALVSGCAQRYVSVRKVPDSPLVERLKLTSRKGPQASARTMQVLRRFGLEEEADGEQRKLLSRLQEHVAEEPTADSVYALAEVAFLAGKRMESRDPRSALDFYGASVAYSYQYLFDPEIRAQPSPFDPQFRQDCELYNGALEECLRMVKGKGALSPGQTHTIESCNHKWEVTVVARGKGWQADSFDKFEFASDYDVSGLRNLHHTYGLGVPLIAMREGRGDGDPLEKHYPPGLNFPVTAFLRVLPDDAAPGSGTCRSHRSVLELYDPLMVSELTLADRPVPLESDLTTPLALFLDHGTLASLGTMGLLRPDESQKLRGLYMAQPYEEGKVPVLFVHGLWSDPSTWSEMFNDLRADPRVRANYQFWFYFYPTGQPFWYSAAQLRNDLAALRQEVDPERRLPTMDQMVLVGHSMGGLVSRLQSVDSRDDFWKTASEEPFQVVKASYEVREALEKTYYFQSNPSVRRVITIATPHRGSEFANSYTRYLGDKLIAFPKMLVEGQKELYKENPGAFGDGSSVRVNTSIDSLAPDSPFLPVMLAAHRAPWIRYHNIVGVTELGDHDLLPPVPTDGVVSYASAHLDDVESEKVVRADHSTAHRHPLSVLEVRRILLDHLDEIRAGPDHRPQVIFAGAATASDSATEPGQSTSPTPQHLHVPGPPPASGPMPLPLPASLPGLISLPGSQAVQDAPAYGPELPPTHEESLANPPTARREMFPAPPVPPAEQPPVEQPVIAP